MISILAISYFILDCFNGQIFQLIDYRIRLLRLFWLLIPSSSIIEILTCMAMLTIYIVRLYGWPMEPQSMSHKTTGYSKRYNSERQHNTHAGLPYTYYIYYLTEYVYANCQSCSNLPFGQTGIFYSVVFSEMLTHTYDHTTLSF